MKSNPVKFVEVIKGQSWALRVDGLLVGTIERSQVHLSDYYVHEDLSRTTMGGFKTLAMAKKHLMAQVFAIAYRLHLTLALHNSQIESDREMKRCSKGLHTFERDFSGGERCKYCGEHGEPSL
jgi:hypothetical protein